MRTSILLSAAAVLLIAATGQANLLTNGGFEVDQDDNGVPDGWGAWADTGAIAPWRTDAANAFEGENYVELTTGVWAVAYFHNTPVTGGTTYYLSALVRTPPGGTGAGAGLKFEFYGGLDKATPLGEVPIFFETTEEWTEYTVTAVAPEGANYATATLTNSNGGNTNWFDAVWLDSYERVWTAAMDPQPADNSRAPVSLELLQWSNPDPNDPEQPIVCDVWFTGEYPEYGLYPGDPNFTQYAELIVSGEPVESVNLQLLEPPIVLEYGNRYFWRVDCTDPAAETTIGRVWSFLADNTEPQVQAGADQYVWLTEGSVTTAISATVDDDGRPDPPAAYTVMWSLVSGAAESVTIADETAEETEVTISATGTYVFELVADDGELTGADQMTVNVFDNPCDAAKAAGIDPVAGDINEDCHVNLLDLAALAGDWLVCTSLDCIEGM